LDRRKTAALLCWSEIGYHRTPSFFGLARCALLAARESKVRNFTGHHHTLRRTFTMAENVQDTCADSVPFIVTRQPLACAFQATHHSNSVHSLHQRAAHLPAMLSTRSTRPLSRAATALLLLSAALISSTSAQGLKTMKGQGCYSSSTPLKDQGENIYQSSGACQKTCVEDSNTSYAVMAMTEGSNCYCGDMLPAESDKVDDSKCDTPCDGYDQEMCKSLRLGTN